jgi:hypothetical protein
LFHTLSSDAVLKREKVWGSAALKADSTLLSTSSATKLEAEDCVFLAHLCGCLGAKHLHRYYYMIPTGMFVSTCLLFCGVPSSSD